MRKLRLGVLASHPIQYQAPLFRELARELDLMVFFAHRQTATAQAAAGFNVEFEWDVDLLGGYEYRFLENVSPKPNVDNFSGCDTPGIFDHIAKDNFDAFLVEGWYLKTYWQAIRACRRIGLSVMVRGDSQLVTARSLLKQIGKEVIYPYVLRQFDACLYVGQKNREYLEHYGVTGNRLFFSPHCVDNDVFAAGAQKIERKSARLRRGLSDSDKAVLFAGKLLERKRPLDMVRALRILLDQDIPVRGVFAGDGPLRARVEEEGRELGVPLEFLGFCNQTQLPEVYATADVLVLPSDGRETWGLVVNEALSCGTPVVVSDRVGCAPDLVKEGETGASFAYGDVSALASALIKVLAQPPAPQAIRSLVDAYSVQAAATGVVKAANWLYETRNRRVGKR